MRCHDLSDHLIFAGQLGLKLSVLTLQFISMTVLATIATSIKSRCTILKKRAINVNAFFLCMSNTPF